MYTALLKVWSDILMAADNQQVTLLALLDLSAAFDCVGLRRSRHSSLEAALRLWH